MNKEIKDQLINCNVCENDCCLETEPIKDYKTYLCFSCGRTTNSLMVKGGAFYEEQVEKLPELYKDFLFEDKNGLTWFPTNINLEEKGMIFLNGISKENSKWAVVKAVPILEEEKEKYPIKGKKGQFHKWRMDMSTIKTFEQNQFMDAMELLGLLG